MRHKDGYIILFAFAVTLCNILFTLKYILFSQVAVKGGGFYATGGYFYYIGRIFGHRSYLYHWNAFGGANKNCNQIYNQRYNRCSCSFLPQYIWRIYRDNYRYKSGNCSYSRLSGNTGSAAAIVPAIFSMSVIVEILS